MKRKIKNASVKKSLLKKVGGGMSIKEIRRRYEDAMFTMGEGSNSWEANAQDQTLYNRGREDAIKFGNMLRNLGIKVIIPK
jgi:transposase